MEMVTGRGWAGIYQASARLVVGEAHLGLQVFDCEGHCQVLPILVFFCDDFVPIRVTHVIARARSLIEVMWPLNDGG